MPSVFGDLARQAQDARDAEGELLAEGVLGVCRAVLPVVDKFGTAFVMIRSDIHGNVERLEAARQRDPARFARLTAIVLDEVQRGRWKDKYSDTRALLWLKRAMVFVQRLLLRLDTDRAVSLSTAASEVYHETLYQYHTWYTSAAFQVALKLVPSRETFLEKLGVADEAAFAEMRGFLDAFAPILADIDKFLKSHDLDDPTPV